MKPWCLPLAQCASTGSRNSELLTQPFAKAAPLTPPFCCTPVSAAATDRANSLSHTICVQRPAAPGRRNRKGSQPAPDAVFRAIAENTDGGQLCGSWEFAAAENAGREGASSNARGGRAPRTSASVASKARGWRWRQARRLSYDGNTRASAATRRASTGARTSPSRLSDEPTIRASAWRR